MSSPASEYARDQTLTLESPVRGDAGATVIALAGGASVELVTIERTTRKTFESQVKAVAVGQYVVVLVDETVHALTDTGVTVWSTEVEGASRIGAVRDGGLVGVLSGDTVIGLDEESGSKLFSVERPPDRPEPEGLFGARWGLALPAWSYLTAYDTRGETQYDENLDGIVETVGTLDRFVIVGLRGGEVIAIGPAGDQVWRQPLEIQWLAPTGGSALPAATEDGPVLVTTEGIMEPLAIGDEEIEKIYRTLGGTICCTVDDDDVSVYRRLEVNPEGVDVEIQAEEIENGGQLPTVLRNNSDTPLLTEVAIEADTARFENATEQVSLGAGENQTLEWDIAEIGAEEATVTVTAGETTVAKDVFPVAGTPPEEMLAVNAEPISVEHGTVTVQIEVTNEGTQPVNDASVEPPGQRLGVIPSGESTTVEQSAPFDSNWNRSLQVRGRVGPERVSTEVDVTVPTTAIDLSVSHTDAGHSSVFADVSLENKFAVPVTDRVRVQTQEQTYERRVEIPGGSVFTLAIPVSRGATVETTLDGLDLSRTITVGGKVDETRTDPVLETGNEPAVRVRREASDALAGYAIQERLLLRNDGAMPARNLHLTVEATEWTTDQLDPGEVITLERRHVVTEPGQVTLDGGEIVHEVGKAQVEPIDISVRPADILTEATVEPGSDSHSLTVTIENGSSIQINLEMVVADLTVDGPSAWEGDELGNLQSIPVGERASNTWQIPADDCELSDRAVRVAFVYQQRSESEPTKLHTLASVRHESDQRIQLSVANGADVSADEYGYLNISVANTGRRSIDEINIKADHEALTAMYAPERDQYLDPGESFVHELSLNPSETGDIEIPLQVEGRLSGNQFSERHFATGPVAPTGKWDETVLDKWDVNIENRDIDQKDATSARNVVSTEYVREGNPR